MTAPDSNATVLREHYADLVERERRPEGVRYDGALPTGTPVVVVALAGALAARITAPDRFLAALEAAAAIQDDAMSRPLSWGRASNGLLHVAFARHEPLDGVPGAMSPAKVAVVGAGLARALARAHQAGTLHGAITTQRIAQSGGRHAALLEFGLFSALWKGGLEARAAAAMLCDEAYVSPEVRSDRLPDERSDVFSLGASLYELLTGKPPHGGRTTSYVMASVLSDEGAAEDAQSNYSEPAVAALLRAIEQSPDDRWQSAAAFAAALETGIDRGALDAPRGRARGCLPVAAAVCAVMLLLASAVGVMLRG